MTSQIRLIKHEIIPDCGSYEVRLPDGRPSKFFYFENLPSRRLQPNLVDGATADAKAFARAEQSKLDSQVCDHRGADVRSAWHVR